MERTPKVTQLWSWLPAFRAVAESQHLPTASKELHLSASALSRAVRMLEVEIGRQLFERHGRQLVLSPPGRILLSSVQEAMRVLQQGVNAVTTTALEGPVFISAPGPYVTVFVLPALEKLRESVPDLVPHISSSSGDLAARLTSGELDIALLDDPVPDERITIYRLGSLSFGVYCSSSHPLARQEQVSLEDVQEHPFVAPPAELEDHWPKHLERRVGMVAQQMHEGLSACAEGRYLAVLPDAVVAAHKVDLRRLPLDLVPDTTLYAATNRLPDATSRVEMVLDAIGGEVREAGRRPPQSYIRELSSGDPMPLEASCVKRPA